MSSSPTEQLHEALDFDCPFCKVAAGSPCVTRTSGRSQERPHSRRRALTLSAEVRQRLAPVQVNALCCVCGQLRTVSDNHRTSSRDPNANSSEAGKANGWRDTKSLKCVECGRPTRHAVLCPADASHRDFTETWQRVCLGDADTSPYGRFTDLERARRDYREMPFPRNPNLHHRFNVEKATTAWDSGERTVVALCGEPDTLHTDPRLWSKYASKAKKKRQQERYEGFVVAEQLSDIEYTDVDTGLEWVDMDCVDCCRVSNNIKRKSDRKRLDWFLQALALDPRRVPDDRVREVMDYLEEVYDYKEGEGD